MRINVESSHPAGRDLERARLLQWAYALALVTIFYNTAEGMASVFFGMEDKTISLFGFGVDSFVEVISGLGIWHMVRRMRQNGDEAVDRFERRALQVTGSAFYLLTAGLLITSAAGLYQEHEPDTAFWGIVISLVSILSMWLLIHYKVKVGRGLQSQAILSDATCTKVCMQLSLVLLLASAGFELTGIGWFDSVGALVIAGLSFREGREAFEKAKGNAACCCKGGCATVSPGGEIKSVTKITISNPWGKSIRNNVSLFDIMLHL
jgi:divalent metal cation (Fe/Co/Zn/Cd) transporter